MIGLLYFLAGATGVLLVPVCFIQVLYLESLRLRAREQPALELFKSTIENKLFMEGERGALAFSLIKHSLLVVLTAFVFVALEHGDPRLRLATQPLWSPLVEAIGISILAMIGLTHVSPQLLYRRTSGRWILPLIPLLRLLPLAVQPLIALLEFLKSLSDIGGPEAKQEEAATPGEEIEALITAGAEEGLIEEEDRKLIQSAVEFGDKTVREVMTPRPQIVAISGEASLEELHKLVVKEQYSRVPVYDGSIDNITGFVHVRDLFQVEEDQRALRKVKQLSRQMTAVPETKPVDDLLRLMQGKGAHMVVVVDEYGNTAGLATMEDLVEEIVGEISDEHDPGRDLAAQSDGSWLASGNLDLDHLAELFEFRPAQETESTTVGGLVQEWMGRVPKAGESVEREGLRIEVMSSDERRVSQVRISRPKVESPNGGAN